MGDACLMRPGGRRLLPDVCGCPVSWIVLVDVCSEGDVLRLPITCFFSKLLGFSNTDEVKYKNLSH